MCSCPCHGTAFAAGDREGCVECAVEDQVLLTRFLEREEKARKIIIEYLANFHGQMGPEEIARVRVWLQGDS